METVADPQSNIRQNSGILQKTGERIVGVRGAKDNTRTLTESTNLGS